MRDGRSLLCVRVFLHYPNVGVLTSTQINLYLSLSKMLSLQYFIF